MAWLTGAEPSVIREFSAEWMRVASAVDESFSTEDSLDSPKFRVILKAAEASELR